MHCLSVRALRRPSGSFLWTRTTTWSVTTVRWGLHCNTHTHTGWIGLCSLTSSLLDTRHESLDPPTHIFTECKITSQCSVEWTTHRDKKVPHRHVPSQPKLTATLWVINKAYASVELWTLLGTCCLNQTCYLTPSDRSSVPGTLWH